METLQELKGTLENSGVLSKKQKDYIKQLYETNLGKTFEVKPKCTDCWHDALIELIVFEKGDKIQMKGGAIVYVDNVLYTRLNITDEVALRVILEQPDKAHYFYNIKNKTL